MSVEKFSKWAKSRKGQRLFVIITFMAVPLTLLMLFTYIPFLEMFKFSFYNMKYSGTRTFVGLKNYLEVFSRDDCFKSLLLAFYYVAASFVQLALALYFATIFCFKLHGKEVFKGLLFFPYLVCGIAIGFIFKFFFTRGFVLDTVLGWIGMPLESLPYWLRDTRINNISLVFTSVWRYLGQNMVLFLGAMMSVDQTLYEAAAIDGANAWQNFRYITFPLLKPMTLFVTITSIISYIQAYVQILIMTEGGPGTATYLSSYIIYDEAFVKYNFGYASALSFVLFVITAGFTWLSFRVSGTEE